MRSKREFYYRAYASETDKVYKELVVSDLPVELEDEFRLGSSKTWKYDPTVPEPILYVVASCDNQVIQAAYFDFSLDKDQLHLFVSLFEVVTLTIFLLGHNIIRYMQRDFVKEYDG